MRRKHGEDRVNEMASKDELNGGRKETRSGRALLTDSSQTPSFERRGGVSKARIPELSSLKGRESGVCERAVGGGLRQGADGVCACAPMCVCGRVTHPLVTHPRAFNREVRDLHTVGGSEVAGITRLL